LEALVPATGPDGRLRDSGPLGVAWTPHRDAADR